MAAPFPALTKTYRHGPYPAIDPTLSELSVTGKVAIITGGGGTIGAAIANSLAQAGIKHVALLGRRMESLNTTKAKLDIDFPKTKVSVYSTDITSRVAVKDAFEKFHAEVGQQVDVLISNAGYLSELSSIADADAEDWVTCINTNIVGSFFVAKEFMSICSSAATVVNITSAAAHVQIPKLSAYSCAKVAVVKLFEFLHSENPGLRVFNLHPGMVDSEMNTKGGLPPLDDSDLPARVTVWLCSPQADFLRGKFLWANWDVDELKAKAKQLESTSLMTLNLEGWPFADGSLINSYGCFQSGVNSSTKFG